MEEYVTLTTKEISIEKDQVTQEVSQMIKIKVYCELKQLERSYNLDLTRVVNDIEQGRDKLRCLVELHKLSLQILNKSGITMMQRIEKNGGWRLR
jgi:hypothetical protein